MDTAESEIQEFPPNNQVISSKGDAEKCHLGVSVRPGTDAQWFKDAFAIGRSQTILDENMTFNS